LCLLLFLMVVFDSAFPLLPIGVSPTGVFVVFDSAYSPECSFVLLAGLVMSGQLVEVSFSVSASTLCSASFVVIEAASPLPLAGVSP